MAIIKWDPFRDLAHLQEKMNRLFENSLVHRHESAISGSWIPVVDMYESDDNIYVKAELPGIKIEEIHVEVKDNSLAIRGERKLEEYLKQENIHRIERNYGKFRRSFLLPSDVDEEKVSATFQDGVLEVILPKLPSGKPKEIEIK